jgi:hypothetical protein
VSTRELAQIEGRGCENGEDVVHRLQRFPRTIRFELWHKLVGDLVERLITERRIQMALKNALLCVDRARLLSIRPRVLIDSIRGF